MRARLSFDACFAPKFFDISKNNHEISSRFPLPNDKNQLNLFMQSESGFRFQNAGRDVIKRLKAWCQKNNIRIDSLLIFESNFPYPGYTSALDLLRDGIPLLGKIVDILTSETKPLSIGKKIIEDMLPDLSVCPPGAFKAIYTAHLKLSSSPDDILMAIRKELSEQTILMMIQQYNNFYSRNYKDTPAQILEGNITHYVNKVINSYAQQLGIQRINDDLEPPSHDQAIIALVAEFNNRISKVITLSSVTALIIQKLEWDKFCEMVESKPEQISSYYAEFESLLNFYGIDEKFSISNLFDADALANGNYVIHSEAESCLLHTVLYRLQNMGYLDLQKAAKSAIIGTDKIVLLSEQPVKMSHVISHDGSQISLISYCIDQAAKGNFEWVSAIEEILPQIEQELFGLLFHVRTPAERIKPIYEAIKQVCKNAGSDLIDGLLMGIEKCVTKVSQLTRLLSLIDGGDRFSFLMRINPKCFANIDDLHNIGSLLQFIADDQITMFLLIAKERQLIRHILASEDAFFSIINRIPSKEYHVLLTCIITKDDAQLINISLYAMLDFLIKLPYEQMHLFIRLMGCAYWQDIINDISAFVQVISTSNNVLIAELIKQLGISYLKVIFTSSADLANVIAQVEKGERIDLLSQLGTEFIQAYVKNWNDAGMILSMLDSSCYAAFLNIISGGMIEKLFMNSAHLIQALGHLQMSQRIAFLQQLGSCHLQRVVGDSANLLHVLQQLRSEDYESFFKLFGPYAFSNIVRDLQSLKQILNNISPEDKTIFIQSVSALFTPPQLLRYKGEDSSIYRELMKHHFSTTSVSEHLMQQPASHLRMFPAHSGQRQHSDNDHPLLKRLM